MSVIGRRQEIKTLNRLLQSKEAEFLAIYGRRRVGKTFLIRQHFAKHLAFELTGQKDGSLPEQLNNFQRELQRHSPGRKQIETPRSWQEAFQLLADYLQRLRSQKKQVIFLDELPWLASPRSRFLPALDHFQCGVLRNRWTKFARILFQIQGARRELS